MTIDFDSLDKDEQAAYKRITRVKGVRSVDAMSQGGLWSAAAFAHNGHQSVATGATRLEALHNLEQAAKILVASTSNLPAAHEVTGEDPGVNDANVVGKGVELDPE